MIDISRTDKSILGQWWWTVDRLTLVAVFILIAFGVMMVAAASPAVAHRLDLGSFHFLTRHIIFLVPSVILMLLISTLSVKNIWRIGTIMFAGSVILLLLTHLVGTEIKGAQRWIHIFGFSIQPSEFIKPAFAIVSAWFIAEQKKQPDFPGYKVSIILFLVALTLLISQPDFGMSFVLSAIWGAQLLVGGLPMVLVVGLGILGIAGVFGAYQFLPHVRSRFDRFFDPSSGDNYQVNMSLESFNNGGLFGVGPGQGTVKLNLPDAHADFIFAVMGEEFGLIPSLFIIGVFAFIVIRCFTRVLNSDDMFIILATTGLLTQFSLQTLIHMASSVHLAPAKGMTLPFISYGGSSTLALGIAVGMLLCFTRRRSGNIHNHPALKKQRKHAFIVPGNLEV